MDKKDIILVGGGGHAVSCVDVIQHNNRHQIKGFVAIEKDGPLADLGFNFLGNDEKIERLVKKNIEFILAVGQINSPEVRLNLFKKLVDLGAELPNIISKNSFVSSLAEIDTGVFVGHKAVINSLACVGKNCIINTSSVIEHGVLIEPHTHIAPSATILGDAKIGWGSFIGAGSVIKEGIKISPKSFIRAGSMVFRDII